MRNGGPQVAGAAHLGCCLLDVQLAVAQQPLGRVGVADVRVRAQGGTQLRQRLRARGACVTPPLLRGRSRGGRRACSTARSSNASSRSARFASSCSVSAAARATTRAAPRRRAARKNACSRGRPADNTGRAAHATRTRCCANAPTRPAGGCCGLAASARSMLAVCVKRVTDANGEGAPGSSAGCAARDNETKTDERQRQTHEGTVVRAAGS